MDTIRLMPLSRRQAGSHQVKIALLLFAVPSDVNRPPPPAAISIANCRFGIVDRVSITAA